MGASVASPAMLPPALARQVDAWIEHDPDPEMAAQLSWLRDAGDAEELAALFGGTLAFGTAGLRAAMGPGPMRINRLVVRRAAWGLAQWVIASGPDGAARGVVIGCDARRNSDVFALDSARVLAAAGVTARVLPPALPTPVGAFATVSCGAAAGVVVTASHNPPGDNGYKVYLPDGSQIVSPVDNEIAAWIERAPLDVPVSDLDDPRIEHLDSRVVEAYVAAAAAQARPVDLTARSRPLSIAYTPLHGVGGATLQAVFATAGLPEPHVAAEQAEPDGAFPTVAFPNPEEPGAMDAVIALADRVGADLVLANDPDADRLGVAVPRRGGGWRVLTGDEIGALLADHVLATTTGPDRLVVTTLVSSSLLGRMAHAARVEYVETFTGFKWMADAVRHRPHRRLVFAYEQALGFLVTPRAVAGQPLDKDGISAAAVFVRLVEQAAAAGRTVEDLLDDLAARFGAHVTAERSVRCEPSVGRALVERWRADPPPELDGRAVTAVEWFAAAGLLRMACGGSTRIQIRPSGTEPKVKVYVEVIDGPPGAADSLVVAVADLLSSGTAGTAP